MTITHCEIHLERLRFYAYHGLLPHERTVGGTYTVDVRLQLSDATAAIRHDQLSGTVNYAEVYELVRKEMAIPSDLIEHVAGRIITAIFERFPLVVTAVVSVRKDNPPMGADCDGCSATLTATR